LSTAEIESALVQNASCAEAAVVGVPDDITGEKIVCFCTLKSVHVDEASISAALKAQVRSVIGPFATPKRIIITTGLAYGLIGIDLPKTRSGKIMRRILRKIAAGDVKLGDCEEVLREKLGDLSTLASPEVVGLLLERMEGGK
jgi:acyl-coenzyme A synthetase/AMP-(fatty) acid ligase